MNDGIVIFLIFSVAFIFGGISAMDHLTDKLERACLIENTIILNDTEFKCQLNPDD